MADEGFLHRLVDFIGEDFQDAMQEFVAEHADVFEYNDQMEHKHEEYEVYKAFTSMVDEKLSEFLETEELSHQDFMTKCQEGLEFSPDYNNFVSAMLAAFEYEPFHDLMMAYKREIAGEGTSDEQTDSEGENVMPHLNPDGYEST
eukprot:GFYU01000430.1.p1 GENE.GFYU01000430.1~~GFYU01000430.1.p1  ORF type:complete len:145 (+),score=30.72 GFYU01000430.1:145-579(+)